MKLFHAALVIALSAFLWCCSPKDEPSAAYEAEEWGDEKKYQLAKCMDGKGWVMYGSYTCSACRAQRKIFGRAFELIQEIECNPHADNNQVKLCLSMNIKKTPAWIQERDGVELNRIEGFTLLEDLADRTECR